MLKQILVELPDAEMYLFSHAHALHVAPKNHCHVQFVPCFADLVLERLLLQVVLKGSDGSIAEVYTFGGVVTSWVKDGRDVLYVRPDAVFDKSKPISGGIPHCWPQFGPGTQTSTLSTVSESNLEIQNTACC